MKKIFKINLFVFCISVFPAYSSGYIDSCGLRAPGRTGLYRWNKLPIELYFHESVSFPAHRIFIVSMNHWNQAWKAYLADKKDVKYTPLFAAPNPRSQYVNHLEGDGYSMLFFLEGNGMDRLLKYKMRKSQLWTGSNRRRGGKLVEADIIMNNRDFHYFYDEGFSKVSKESARRISSIRGLSFWAQLKRRMKLWFSFLDFFKKTDRAPAGAFAVVAPKGQVDFVNMSIYALGHALLFLDEVSSYSLNMPHGVETKRPGRSGIAGEDLEKIFCAYSSYLEKKL